MLLLARHHSTRCLDLPSITLSVLFRLVVTLQLVPSSACDRPALQHRVDAL